MSDILNVTVGDGKYTYIMRADHSTTALRYGGHWPAFDVSPTDKLHYALAAEVDTLRECLRAIVERADNGELGTSKVQDMKRLALALLAKHGGAQ